ncbi:hypothetical protein [Paraburkholderia sp. BR10954]
MRGFAMGVASHAISTARAFGITLDALTQFAVGSCRRAT